MTQTKEQVSEKARKLVGAFSQASFRFTANENDDAAFEFNRAEYASTRDELLAYIASLEADAKRLDWLEAAIEEDPILLHINAETKGFRGLGLRPGYVIRSLRDAIDAAFMPAPSTEEVSR
jgi:hypothetical protein